MHLIPLYFFWFLGAMSVQVSAVPKHYIESRQPLKVRFYYSATVPTLPKTVHQLRIWIPIPSNSVHQSINSLSVRSESRYQITYDKRFGNRMIFLSIEHPKTPISVEVSWNVVREEARSCKSLLYKHPSYKNLLSSDRLVPVGGRYSRIADAIIGGTKSQLKRAFKLFQQVSTTLRYDYKEQSPELGRGDSAFMCDYKMGNCSDIHSYLISLARSCGIPCLLTFGFPITGIPVSHPYPNNGMVTGYHCWVWMHTAEKGWIPVDAADARRWKDHNYPAIARYLFGRLVTARAAVAVSRGRDIILQPPQHGGPLNYFIYPYAEADGNSVPVTWKVRFDLEGVKG